MRLNKKEKKLKNHKNIIENKCIFLEDEYIKSAKLEEYIKLILDIFPIKKMKK